MKKKPDLKFVGGKDFMNDSLGNVVRKVDSLSTRQKLISRLEVLRDQLDDPGLDEGRIKAIKEEVATLQEEMKKL